MRQEVFIKGRDAAIDSGQVRLIVKARLGTYDSQPDTATLFVHLGSTNSDFELSRTATNGRLLLSSASRILPAGLRSVFIGLVATHTVGYCDAYFDKISIKLVHV